jgi:hypothetical protein
MPRETGLEHSLFHEGERGGLMPGEVGLGNSLLSESDWNDEAGLGSDELMNDNGEGGI